MNLDKDDQSAHYPMKEEHLVLTIHILEAKKYHNSIGGGGGSKRPPKSTLYLFCHFCFWVPNCPLFIAVPNCPVCQIVLFYIAVPNRHGAKLSCVPNCTRCQIVLYSVYIQYKFIFLKIHIPPSCARRAHKHPPTDTYLPIVGRIYPIPKYNVL